MPIIIATISVGASIGAISRWILGVSLNAIFPTLPLGTLIANLIGGYLVGLAIAFFSNHTALALEWRLVVITGFLGGLTSFSTFSAEVVSLLQKGRIPWACAAIFIHVAGSLILAFAGMATYAGLNKF